MNKRDEDPQYDHPLQQAVARYFKQCLRRDFDKAAEILYPGDLDKFKTNVLWSARAMAQFGEANDFLAKFGSDVEIEDLEALSPAAFFARFLEGATGMIDDSDRLAVERSFVVRDVEVDGDDGEVTYAYDPTPGNGSKMLWERAMRFQRIGDRWFGLMDAGMSQLTSNVRRNIADFRRREKRDTELSPRDQERELERIALYGYVDEETKVPVIEPRFRGAGDFSAEGLAPVQFFRKWGYINKAGVTVIPPQYDFAQEFVDGVAAVAVEVENSFEFKWTYIDTNGKQMWGAEFEEAMPFSDGLAAVMRDGLWGYIDPNGEVVIPFQFHTAGPLTRITHT
ncbi:MAG: WG repeat-containing protein [Verrucomicrobiales bacterium]